MKYEKILSFLNDISKKNNSAEDLFIIQPLAGGLVSCRLTTPAVAPLPSLKVIPA